MNHINPTQINILKCLLIRPYTIRELIFDIGCNWPPDFIQYLRKGFMLDTHMKIKSGFNRYGDPMKYRVYILNSIDEALKLLNGAVTPPNKTVNNLAKQSTEDTIISQ